MHKLHSISPSPAFCSPKNITQARKCGLISIVGRPNMGKSTLLNTLVGQKVSITSSKPQTTRHQITGICTQSKTQFLFVDTPGFQTSHINELNKILNKTVRSSIQDVDLVLFVVQAGQFTTEDIKVLKLLQNCNNVILIANKLDQITHRPGLLPWLREMQNQYNFRELIPMSAKRKKDVARLLTICERYLPEQNWLYDSEAITNRNENFLVTEIIREKVFRFTGDELPYCSNVLLDKFEESLTKPSTNNDQKQRTTQKMLKIAATIIVERDSHKAIIVGAKGERIKLIGMQARLEIERLLQSKVFLQLWVKVHNGWANDVNHLHAFKY